MSKLNQLNQGQSLISNTGQQQGIHDTNPYTTGTNAVGSIQSPGAWESMIRTNPTAATSFQSMLATLQAVTWEVKPCGAKKSHVKFVEKLYFEMFQRSFKSFIRTLLNAPLYGFAPHEITTYQSNGYTWIKDLQYRQPRTFNLWTVAINSDGSVNATQQYYKNNAISTARYGRPGMPGGGWLFWPVFGEGVFGQSVLRPIYNEHKEKEDIRKIRRIAIQKYLLDTIAIKIRNDEDIDELDEATKASIDNSLEELQRVIYHEKNVISLPGIVEDVVQLFNDSESIPRSIEAEQHCDLQVMLSFGSQWMGRGLLGAYSSNAASKTDITEQRNLRRFYIDWISESVQWLSDYFIDYNYGPQEKYPELSAIYVPEIEPETQANIAVKLRKGGLLSIDDDDEDYFRGLVGMPKRTKNPSQPRADDGRKEPPETEGDFDQDTGEDTRERESEGDYT